MSLPSYISNNSNVQIIIGGYDYTPFVIYDSVNVTQTTTMSSDTLDLVIEFLPGRDTMMNAITGQYVPVSRPKCGQEIVWQNPKLIVRAPDGTNQPYREFGGVVVEVHETDDPPNLVYTVRAKSYEHWFDRHLVTGYYNQDHPENIIRSIVNTYAPMFTTYNVQNTNITVVPQYFDYQKPSEAVKSIADQIEYSFYIDAYRDCHFAAIESLSSPLPGNTLNVDTNTQNYGDLEIIENGEQQFNRIFIKGFKTRSKSFVILTYTGDGNTTQWSTGYRISSLTGDVKVQVYSSMTQFNGDTSFKNGGNPTAGTTMTIKRDILDGAPEQQGANNTAYVHFTQNLVRISNFNNGGPVPSGYVVAVRFYYLQDTVFLAQDPAAQSKTASIEGTDGVYEMAYSDKSLTNSTMSAVQAKGQLLLMKYKFPQISGTFTTYFNAGTTQGWRAGQYFTLRSNRRFGGINQTMFVQQVQKQIVKNDANGLVTLYTITFADSPFLV